MVGLPIPGVYDFINFVTGREPGNTYARMTFLRLTKEGSEHAKETVTNCYSFKIQGSRGPNHRISEYLNLLNPTEEEAEEDYAEGLGQTARKAKLGQTARQSSSC